MSEFDFDTEDFAKEQKEREQAKNGGGGGFKYEKMSLSPDTTVIALLPPLPRTGGKKSKLIKTIIEHQLWGFDATTGKRKLEGKCTSAKMIQEKDNIIGMGLKYRAKYKDSKNKKLKDLHLMFYPKSMDYANVLDIEEVKKLKKAGDPNFVKSKVLRLPSLLEKHISEEIMALRNAGESAKSLVDINEGKLISIKGNGKKGKEVRYEVIRFSAPNHQFGNKLGFTSSDVIKTMHDLEKLEFPFSRDKEKQYLEKLLAKVRSIEAQETGGDVVDNVDADAPVSDFDFSADSGDEFDMSSSSSDSSEFDMGSDSDSDFSFV